jgi:hypothetical protein
MNMVQNGILSGSIKVRSVSLIIGEWNGMGWNGMEWYGRGEGEF